MPNLEVKRCNADGSVGNPHVRVGHRQVLNERGTLLRELSGVFLLVLFYISYFGFYFGALLLVRESWEKNLIRLFVLYISHFYFSKYTYFYHLFNIKAELFK